MSGHTQKRCARCATVLTQCRCMGPHTIEWAPGPCGKCLGRSDADVEAAILGAVPPHLRPALAPVRQPASSTVHELKTDDPAYRAVLDGRKRFEFRRNDRGFTVGDVLRLREWYADDPGGYTCHELLVRVTYILNGPDYGIPTGYACMSIRTMDEEPATIDGGKR